MKRLLVMSSNSATPLVVPTIMISVLVGVGLFILNTLPKESIPFADSTTPIPSNPNSPTKTPFTFYEDLKNGEVLITDSHYISTPKNSNLDNPILLQIAATSSESAARNLADQLIQGGLTNVIIVKRPSSNGMLYLVRTTPYLTYDKLKAGLAIAEKLNHHPDKIEIKN